MLLLRILGDGHITLELSGKKGRALFVHGSELFGNNVKSIEDKKLNGYSIKSKKYKKRGQKNDKHPKYEPLHAI